MEELETIDENVFESESEIDSEVEEISTVPLTHLEEENYEIGDKDI